MYVGESATLSYLQLVRMMVDHVAGPCDFTQDPSRHKIMENVITLPPNIRTSPLLPDRKTADVLVEAYFVNVFQPKILSLLSQSNSSPDSWPR